MKVRTRFLVALMASLAMHLGVLTAPGWHVALLDDLLQPESAATLEARLAAAKPKPQPPAPAPIKPRPAKRHTAPASAAATVPAVPGSVGQVPSPAVEGPPAADTAPEPVAATPAPAEILAAAADIALPKRVHIQYVVTRGEGFIVGLANHDWRYDGGNYSLRNVAETTGLAALFRPARIVQASEGEVREDGLRPREFTTERNGAPGDSARFDWTAGRVALSGGPKEALLEAGTQDMLSMFYQLALMALEPGSVVSVPVATGKKLERQSFTVLGQEQVMLPQGECKTLHLRTQGTGGDATEVWLALESPRLPLKIRHVDRKGEIFDQVAERIEFDGSKEGTR